MKLKQHRLLAYNILAIMKLLFMISMFFAGLILIVGEPILHSIPKLLLFKIVGGLAIYIAYRIYDASANRER